MVLGAGKPLSSRLAPGALAVVSALGLTSCGAAQGDQAPQSGASVPAPRTSSATVLDTRSPEAFFEALRGPLRTMGQCTAEQTRSGNQWKATAELALQAPLAARIHLPPPPRLTEVMIVDGKAFVKGGQSDDELWHVGDPGPLNHVIGEMDCRTVIDDVERAAKSVEVGPPATLRDKAALTYTVLFDVAAWSSLHGEQRPSGGSLGTMTLWVRDGQLSQIETGVEGSRVTTYTWFPGRPDVAAPPADQVAR